MKNQINHADASIIHRSRHHQRTNSRGDDRTRFIARLNFLAQEKCEGEMTANEVFLLIMAAIIIPLAIWTDRNMPADDNYYKDDDDFPTFI